MRTLSFIQACLNGARPGDYHPALPRTASELARDGRACVAAGAACLHLHPRDETGCETIAPDVLDETLSAMRALVPGVPIGISTGEWIEGDADRTLRAIAGWRRLPDYASINFSEAAAPEVLMALQARGVGVEAGLADETDAERLLTLGLGRDVLRILVEIDLQGRERAIATADAVLILTARLARPRLLHGFDATVWPLTRKAIAEGLATRSGLEDGDLMPDGSLAAGNAGLVAATHALMRRAPHSEGSTG
jgi:uncharacterized protein (DUF849 family)